VEGRKRKSSLKLFSSVGSSISLYFLVSKMVKVFPVIIFFILILSVSFALNTSKLPRNRCHNRTHSLIKRLFGTSMKSEKDNVLLDPPTTSSSNNVVPPHSTYSLTYSLTHSLTHLLTHLSTH